MIRGFHHIGATVSDVDAAERFFVEAFGMKRLGGGVYDFDYIRRSVGYPDAVLKIAVLGYDDQASDARRDRLELIQYLAPKAEATDTAPCRAGAAHLCFAVDDIEAEYARLKARGVEFNSTPNEVTFGINKGARAVYGRAPCEIVIELFQPAPKPQVAEAQR